MKSLSKSHLAKVGLICALPLALGSALYIKSRPIIATQELTAALERDDYHAVRKWSAQAGQINIVAKGRTPLFMAVDRNDIATMRLLLQKGAQVNRLKLAGADTLLMIAVRRCNESGVKLLLTHGADVTVTNDHGFSALMISNNGCCWKPHTGSPHCDDETKKRQKAIRSLLKLAGATY